MSTLSEFVTTSEAAEILNISTVRVRQLCQEKRIGKKIGDRYIITKDELKQFAKIPRRRGRPKS